jgi:uncharacterized membrane protein YhaH (DUF805 family)
MNWYVKVLRQYTDFTGRARRAEYWVFTLVNVGISALLVLLLNLIVAVAAPAEALRPVLVLPLLVYWLAMVLPGLAVLVRRLHDTDRSGAFVFLAWIPLIGDLFLLVFTIGEGTRGPNRYGPDPLAPEGGYPPAPWPPVAGYGPPIQGHGPPPEGYGYGYSQPGGPRY